MAEACLFCRIGRREIPAALAYEDEELVALQDISPQAPLHLLLIPRRHISSLQELQPGDDALVGRLVRVAAELAAREGVGDGGYRLVANCNRDGGQTVFHLHFHLLGGRPMHWPPG